MEEFDYIIADYETGLAKTGCWIDEKSFGYWPVVLNNTMAEKSVMKPAIAKITFHDMVKSVKTSAVITRQTIASQVITREAIAPELITEPLVTRIASKEVDDLIEKSDLPVIKKSHKKIVRKKVAKTFIDDSEKDWRLWYSPFTPLKTASEATETAIIEYSNMRFESKWSEWVSTEKEILSIWKAYGGKPRKANIDKKGFMAMNVNNITQKVSVDYVESIRMNKISDRNTLSCMKVQMDLGSVNCRRYIAYKNVDNPHSSTYCIHYIKRIT